MRTTLWGCSGGIQRQSQSHVDDTKHVEEVLEIFRKLRDGTFRTTLEGIDLTFFEYEQCLQATRDAIQIKSPLALYICSSCLSTEVYTC
jgi:hypothetical protein